MEGYIPIFSDREGTSTTQQSLHDMDFRHDVDGMTGIDWLAYDHVVDENENPPEEDDTILEDDRVDIQSELEPFMGLQFDSLDKAEEFYNKYAYRIGFSIRKGNHYVSAKTKKVTSRVFMCSKEGFHKPKTKENNGHKGTPQKDVISNRTGCKAQMRVKLEEDTKWVVMSFEKEHNHDLTNSPSKKRFHRSHRRMSSEVKDLIHTMHDQNISAAQIMSLISSQQGGICNVTFTRKDVSNTLVSLRRRYIGVDVASTIEHFRKQQAINPTFFYSVLFDNDGCARNIFWVDARSRMAYQTFGDVITFDTTYMTNRYNMPFAPFIGVNHHRQSTLFGCALLRDETADSFVWVFETFLEAMYGKHPKAILTDQDPAMKKAIRIVFPSAIHRCCQWHIMRKAREHLGVIYGTVVGFTEEFQSCINHPITIDEFEERWKKMIISYNLSDNTHLTLLWNIREQWIPVYFRDTFFANMSTTQRSESMNAIFKDHVNNHLPLFKFVQAFEKVIENRYDKEDEEDYRSKDAPPTLWSYAPIEKHARDIYTRSIFKVFKEQMKLTSCYDIEEVRKDSLYNISRVDGQSLAFISKNSYKVHANLDREEFCCECKLFQFSGILCGHILKLMLYLKVHKIPPLYVMNRWTMEAKSKKPYHCIEDTWKDIDGSTPLGRYNSLCRSTMKLVGIASKNKDTYLTVQELIEKTYDNLLLLQKSMEIDSCDEGMPSSQTHIPTQGSQCVLQMQDVEDVNEARDPPPSHCKGNRKPQRFKPQAELKAKRQRTCSTCNGKGHNSRTCKSGVVKDISDAHDLEQIDESDEE